jgi:hypothetical protein
MTVRTQKGGLAQTALTPIPRNCVTEGYCKRAARLPKPMARASVIASRFWS